MIQNFISKGCSTVFQIEDIWVRELLNKHQKQVFSHYFSSLFLFGYYCGKMK